MKDHGRVDTRIHFDVRKTLFFFGETPVEYYYQATFFHLISLNKPLDRPRVMYGQVLWVPYTTCCTENAR